MLFAPTLSIGIDLSTSRPAYAALDQERRLAALGRGAVEDVLAFLGGQTGALAAVNVPLHADWVSLRDGDASRQPDETPASRWAGRASLFRQRLQKLGYLPYPSEKSPLQWLETNAQTIFLTLAPQRLLPRHALEGRVQRQLLLYENGVGLSDPMEFFEEITRRKLLLGVLPLEMIYTSQQLDALAAAHVAWLAAFQPERLSRRDDGLLLPINRDGRPRLAK